MSTYIKNAGTFEVTIKKADLGESSEKGTPFVALTGETSEGEQATAYLYLSEKALERSVKVLNEVFEFDGNFEKLAEQVEGKQARFVTEIEDYNGKERTVVKWVNAIRTVKPISNASTFLKELSKKASKMVGPF